MADISQIKLDNTTYDIRDTSKAPLASPQLTGTPTAPTAAAGTNSTQIATTAFVQAAMRANDAMVFKGTIGSTGATVTALPSPHSIGWTYKVIDDTISVSGKACEPGDMIICIADGSTSSDADWTVVQANTDGTVTGPASSANNRVAVFDGTSGKVIKDSGFTIGKSVPANAKFKNTSYVYSHTFGEIGSATAGTAIPADDITAWNAGSVPTLGDPITATVITDVDAGSAPTLGTPITASNITDWSAGSVPTLGTAIPADDITGWSAGSAASFSVSNGVLTITPGTAPSLSYTPKSIPNVTNVGTAPSLTKTAVTIPNVTNVGKPTSITHEDVSIPNVTSVGAVPSLSYTAKSIPNITVQKKNVVVSVGTSTEEFEE